MVEDKDLYLSADAKIERLKEEVSQLVKSDLGLGTKIDVVLTEQRLLKERFEEGVSKTAYKTYEMVNQIFSQLKDLAGENKMRDHKINKVENMVEWFYRGLIFVFVAGMLIGLWKFK